MKRLICSLIFALVSTALARAQSTYRIAPANGSELVLLVDKTGVLSGKRHRLAFTQYSGNLVYNRENVSASNVQLTIDVVSLQVQDDWVKEKDRVKIRDYAESGRMLSAERFPQLSFMSARVAAGARPNSFEATGQLSLAGKTHTVTVSADLKDRPGGAISLAGGSKFRLTDFGLKPPSAALGSVGTKDEVSVEFHLTAMPSGAPQ